VPTSPPSAPSGIEIVSTIESSAQLSGSGTAAKAGAARRLSSDDAAALPAAAAAAAAVGEGRRV
jgi:hypothetical protein